MFVTTESFIEIDQVSLFIKKGEAYPNRPTVVFLHDSLGCVALWRDFPESLCRTIQCNFLIYDRQGYGKSSPMPTYDRTNEYMEHEADVLFKIITKLDVRDVILFGHSDGGSIALIAASKYPATVRALVVEAAHIFVEDITLQGIRSAKKAYESTDLKQRLTRYHGDNTDRLFNAWTETWLRESFRAWNIEKFLSNIHCAVLFIQGEQDEYGSLDQVHGVARQVSGKVEVAILPGIHHTPHKESPQQIIQLTNVFMKNLERTI